MRARVILAAMVVAITAMVGAGCRNPAIADRPAGEMPATPRAIAPGNGATTGSARVAGALRPRFVWSPVAAGADGDALSYDLEIDATCVAGAVVHARFVLPTVRVTGLASASWRPARDLVVGADAPIGRRYCWHVRACHGNTCSPWSRTRYLDVGRAASDVDGDGYSDLVIGAPLIDNGGRDRGSAFVYRGGPDGMRAPVRLDEPEDLDGAAFGVAVAIADLDGDRFDDVIVGAAGSEDARGALYVYPGGSTGIAPERRVRLARGDVADDWFGATVAGLGDVDGDGREEIAVGAHGSDGEGVDWGLVEVFYGAAGSTTATVADDEDDARAPLRLGAPAAHDYDGFGAALGGGGDLDGDGYADLIVGAPGVDTAGDRRGRERGTAYVFRGSADGLASFPTVRLEAPVPLDHDRFGFAVALAGDLDGDGRGELLIGAPSTDGADADSGMAYLYRGADTGPDRLPTTLVGDGGDGTAYQRFGSALTGAGDLDGDGFVDFAIGTTGAGRGRALVYRGGREQLARAPAVVLREEGSAATIPTLFAPTNGNLRDFGAALSGAGDLDGDGYADLAVAASGADNGGTFRGSVLLFRGGPGSAPPWRLDDPDLGEHDQFGHTLAGN